MAVAVSAAETAAAWLCGHTGEATQNRVRQVRVRQVGFRWQSRSFGARRSGSMAVGPSWLRGRAGPGPGPRRAVEGRRQAPACSILGPEPEPEPLCLRLLSEGRGRGKRRTPPPGATSWVPKEEKLSWRTGALLCPSLSLSLSFSLSIVRYPSGRGTAFSSSVSSCRGTERESDRNAQPATRTFVRTWDAHVRIDVSVSMRWRSMFPFFCTRDFRMFAFAFADESRPRSRLGGSR